MLVLVLTIAGLLLRWWGIGAEGLWLDEGQTFLRVTKSFSEMMQGVIEAGTNPPLHYILLHGWIRLFGDSLVSMRFMSLLFSAGCIPLIYILGKNLFDSRTALWATILTSLSAQQIYFAQEARPHALMALLVLASMTLLVKLQQQFRMSVAVGYLLATVGMLYTQPYGPFFLLVQNVYVLLVLLGDRATISFTGRRWLLLQGIIVAAFTPWLFIMVQKLSYIQSQPLWFPKPLLGDLAWVFKIFANRSAILGAFMLMLLPLACFSIKAIDVTIKRKSLFASLENASWIFKIPQPQSVVFLSMWLGGAMLIPFAVSHISSPIFNVRYMLPAAFAFYLLVGRALVNINNKYFSIITLLLILIVYPIETIQAVYRTDKENWHIAVPALEKAAMPGDLLIFNACFYQANAFDYYAQRKDLIKSPFPTKGRDIVATDREKWDELIMNQDRIWLIICHPGQNIEYLLNWAKETHVCQQKMQFYDIKIYFFERKPVPFPAN